MAGEEIPPFPTKRRFELCTVAFEPPPYAPPPPTMSPPPCFTPYGQSPPHGPPPPAAPGARLIRVTSGPCSIVGLCVRSGNYPNPYDNGETCLIEWPENTPIRMVCIPWPRPANAVGGHGREVPLSPRSRPIGPPLRPSSAYRCTAAAELLQDGRGR